MKRSEMIEHIRDEILEMVANRDFSNEHYLKYYTRKTDSLLAMIEGFGMSPPNLPDKGINDYCPQEWEPEDDK